MLRKFFSKYAILFSLMLPITWLECSSGDIFLREFRDRNFNSIFLAVGWISIVQDVLQQETFSSDSLKPFNISRNRSAYLPSFITLSPFYKTQIVFHLAIRKVQPFVHISGQNSTGLEGGGMRWRKGISVLLHINRVHCFLVHLGALILRHYVEHTALIFFTHTTTMIYMCQNYGRYTTTIFMPVCNYRVTLNKAPPPIRHFLLQKIELLLTQDFYSRLHRKPIKWEGRVCVYSRQA